MNKDFVNIPMIDWDKVKLYRRPELPSLEFFLNKIHYTITDFRLLNAAGTHIFFKCIQGAKEQKGIKTITFTFSDTDDFEGFVYMLECIVMGFEISAKKRGRDGFDLSMSFLISGCSVNYEERTIEFTYINDDAMLVYEFFKDHEDGSFNDLCVFVINKNLEEMI